MWELPIKKAERQRTDASELWCWRTLENPLDSKEIKPVNPKGNQPWIFIGRTDAEDETPILWPPDAKDWLTGKDPDSGKDWGQEEKGMTGNEMIGWHHHQLNGHEFEQPPGYGDGQGGLACYNPWGCKSRTQLSDWITTTNVRYHHCYSYIVMINNKKINRALKLAYTLKRIHLNQF